MGSSQGELRLSLNGWIGERQGCGVSCPEPLPSPDPSVLSCWVWGKKMILMLIFMYWFFMVVRIAFSSAQWNSQWKEMKVFLFTYLGSGSQKTVPWFKWEWFLIVVGRILCGIVYKHLFVFFSVFKDIPIDIHAININRNRQLVVIHRIPCKQRNWNACLTLCRRTDIRVQEGIVRVNRVRIS